MFRTRVVGDLSHAPGRLKDADGIAEDQLRRLVKGFIRERHTPKQSDLRPVGEFIAQTIAGFVTARREDVETTEKSVKIITQLSSDLHYRQRNLLKEALYIADNILVTDLLEFYQVTKTSNLAMILPGWKRRVKPQVLTYRAVKEK